MKLLKTLTREGFKSPVIEETDGEAIGKVHFVADFDVDVDGRGSSHGDPCYQPDTSLHFEGKPLNSDEDYFMVVPGDLPEMVKGIVLGCQGKVTNLRNGKSKPCVVGDLGPTSKDGEGSRILAIDLGINPSPVNGGEDNAVILYEFWPGVPAVVGDKTYTLQRH